MDHVEQADIAAPEVSCDPVLKPQLSGAWALRLAHLPAIALLGVLFLLASYLPIRPTDIWGHVVWGEWIIEHRQLPLEDPTFALAQGMRVIDSAWLSQVIFAAIDRLGGPEWLSNVFAIVTLVTWLVIWRVLYLRSGNWLTSFAMLLVVFAIAFSRLTTIRPEIFAWLCFAVLWWFLTPTTSTDFPATLPAFRRTAWLGVPLVMMLWANLHGSFICGLVVLATSALGILASTLWRTKSLRATLGDSQVQHWIMLAELGLLATLVNPYGVDLLISTAKFAGNSNLKDVLEWLPMSFGSLGSYEFVGAWVLAMLLLRFSRQKMQIGEVLAVAAFGVATLAGNRMIGWFALTFGVAFMPLMHDLLRKLPLVEKLNAAHDPDVEVGRGFPIIDRSWSYSLIGLLLVWIAFALSPTSAPALGNKSRTPSQLYGPDTPVGLTDYLRENPPDTLIFCPQWWGDWIYRSAPGARPFMTSNIHLAPHLVWADYLRISNMHAGWGNMLGRYRAEHVVLDRKVHTDLDRALRRDANWRLLYEDDRAALFALRKSVTPNPPAAASPAATKGAP